MKSYNGFTPEQRMLGEKIINQAIFEGKLKPASECKCVACGQDKGIRHYHTEDYSPSKIVSTCMVLCWRCHMILHSKYRNKAAYDKYFAEIKEGKQYPPVYKHNFEILKENGF